MSATVTAPPAGERSTPVPARPAAQSPNLAYDDARRTAIVAGGTILGLLPMLTVFSDVNWLVEVVGAIVLLIGPAALLRLRSGPRARQLLPGLVLVFFYAVALYLHASAYDGILPWRASWHVVVHLREQANRQVATSTAPMVSTRALRMQIVPGLALLAAVIDYLAVVRRSPALAGVPLLALFTICGASAGTSVGWFPFTGAAAGFLLILSADARVNLLRWGRIIARQGVDQSGTPQLALSGRRIGVLAVVIALFVPLALPGLSRNLLVSAFHQQGSGGGSGAGTGLSPFANLRGNLTRSQIVPLLSVQVSATKNPFYLRSKVLDEFTTTGWRDSGTQDITQGIASGPIAPEPEGVSSSDFTARVRVEQLSDDAAPTFADLRGVTGLGTDWQFDYERATVVGGHTKRGMTYTEQVAEPTPSAAQLRSQGNAVLPESTERRWTELPADTPPLVRSMAADLTRGKLTPYDRARALNDFFTDPANGFVYDLQTKSGDSGNDLVDFLNNRIGFCQQYAAALAVFFRVSGIPSRVVLGYTHKGIDKQGSFPVTNRDAHAWVEASLPGVGWLPFDPTPIDPRRATTLPYAPRPSVAAPSASGGPSASAPISRGNREAPTPTATAAGAGHSGGLHISVPTWLQRVLLVLATLAVLLCVLPAYRWFLRRRRWEQARRTHSVEPIWAELEAAATDAGLSWSTTLTPRQVPPWLAGLGITPAGDVTELASQLERQRYAQRTDPPTDEVLQGFGRAVAVATADMSQRLDRWPRLRAMLFPSSVTRRR